MNTYLLDVLATGALSGVVVALGVLGTLALPWTAAEIDEALASGAWLLERSRVALQRAPEAVAGFAESVVGGETFARELVPRRW